MSNTTPFAQRLSTLAAVTLRDLETFLEARIMPMHREGALLLLEVAFTRCIDACVGRTE